MQTLTLENTVSGISIGNTAPYWLVSVEGITGINNIIEEQKAPGQDGSTYINSQLDNRYITITGVITGISRNDLNTKKRNIQNLFNPKLETTLTYSNEDYTKDIVVVLDGTPKFTDDKDNRQFQYFIINLRANKPFLLDVDFTGQILAVAIPTFSFPLTFDPTITFSEDGDNRTILTNSGDVECSVIIEFNGPAINPLITNETTGEFIKVNKTLDSGEKLIITTEFGNKRVVFDDGLTQINAFGLIDLDSTFFQLLVGNNSISYNTDTGVTTAEVLVQWKNRFLGF